MLATGGTVNASTSARRRVSGRLFALHRWRVRFLSQSFGERLTAIAMVMMVIGYLVWPLVQ